MTRLPGWTYRGPQPDGYMSREDVIGLLSAYARSFGAPVHEETAVTCVEASASGWRVATDRGTWRARHVAIATGYCQRTRVPPASRALPSDIVQVAATAYRNPAQLPDGGVLVVGASASGIQLADEIAGSGRPVTLAVGRHTRLPRHYRGRDILYWLDRIGALTRPVTDLSRPEEGRREPSMQLVGGDPPATLDLAVLSRRGVRLAGRLIGVDGARARFADDLAATTGEAEARMRRLLARIDSHIAAHGLDRSRADSGRPATVPAAGAPGTLDLRTSGIRSVVWATGYERSYPWLHAPVLDDAGDIRQVRGRTPAPGLYVLGLQFMIRRNSSFIDGVGRDALEIADDIARRAGQRRTEAA
jgi:putative flavoprotein involved in K+ transport